MATSSWPNECFRLVDARTALYPSVTWSDGGMTPLANFLARYLPPWAAAAVLAIFYLLALLVIFLSLGTTPDEILYMDVGAKP